MRNYVIINGVNSNTINGLGINELPPITKPSMRTDTEEIDGRDGDIITKLGYSAYDKTITIGLWGTTYDVNDIISFFTSEGTITFSNEPDKFYKFTMVNEINVESLLRFKKATITFHCQPFKYPLTETPQEIDYDYIEVEDVESASISNTALSTMEIDLLGNTSQTGTPTPSTPIDVNVVSGDNEIVVCGKNLLGLQDVAETTTDGITYSVSNNELSISGTKGNSGNIVIPLKSNISLITGTNYWLSGVLEGTTGKNFDIQLKDDNNTNIMSRQQNQLPANYNLVSGTGTKLAIYIAYGTTFTNFKIKLQIENGSTATPYEPHQSQTYEVDLPVENLFDTFNVVDGEYYNTSGNEVLNGDFFRMANYVNCYGMQNITISGASTSYAQLIFYDENKNFLDYWGVRDRTIAVPNNAYYFRASGLKSEKDTVMIEKGTKANSYTPYGTTPIELCKIGTYQDYFTKNSGKNMFDKDSATYEAGYFGSSDGEAHSGGSSTIITSYTPIKPNTDYTLSCNNIERIVFYNQDKSVASVKTPPTTNVYQINENAYYIRFQARGNTFDLNTIMLNEGSTALPYEPYGTGLWCKYNAIGKVVLDGSETGWEDEGGGAPYAYTLNNLYRNNAFSSVMSNYYQSSYWNESWGGLSSLVTANTYTAPVPRIKFKNTSISSLADFKTWLTTHNTSVYYVLQTPYLSLIEDNNLIEQLDNLQNAMSYNGTTNINQVNNDLPFLLDLKVLELGSDEAEINNTGNVYSKPLIALEGTGIVNVYLNDNQIFQVDMTDNNKINIDIEKLEAYNPDDNTLMNRKITGDISKFIFNPGNNTVKIDGLLTKATISNFVRWL